MYLLCLSVDNSHVTVNFSPDENCIQVRAPDDCDGNNRGLYRINEHIGHLRKEYSARLAPIIDELTVTGMLSSVKFDCFLRDSDTTHHRNGYCLNIVVMCSHTSEFCDYLKNVFIDSNL